MSDTNTDADLEIVSSVLLDATPEPIFDAYADATLLARWWGPAGFTSNSHEFESGPGAGPSVTRAPPP
jgi:uncharacterized protein YndB with AHSA1/START domain